MYLIRELMYCKPGMMSGPPQGAEAAARKEMEELMKDYHDLVTKGKREIYRIEN